MAVIFGSVIGTEELIIWAQLFKTNNIISKCIGKTLIIKYGRYAKIFA